MLKYAYGQKRGFCECFNELIVVRKHIVCQSTFENEPEDLKTCRRCLYIKILYLPRFGFVPSCFDARVVVAAARQENNGFRTPEMQS
jgi:hypothetical protein